MFGGSDMSCFNSPPKSEFCKDCGGIRRFGAVHTEMHDDTQNDPLQNCRVTPGGELFFFTELATSLTVSSSRTGSYAYDTRHLVYLAQLGIIIQVSRVLSNLRARR